MHLASAPAVTTSAGPSTDARQTASAILDRGGLLLTLHAASSTPEPFGIAHGALFPGVSFADICADAGLVALADAVRRVVDATALEETVRYDARVGAERQTWDTTVTALVDSGTILVCGFDVTDVEHSLGELARRARIDTLTGVSNRSAALERMASDLRTGIPLAVLLVDLDHFKFVNDSLGHDAGDAVLTETARRLSRFVDRDGFVARIGGDEFVVAREFARNRAISGLAEDVRAALSVPIDVNGRQVTSSASIGVAFSTEEHARPEDLLRDADVALYHAKSAGRDRVELFTVEQRDQLLRSVHLESELRSALQNDALTIALQPIVHVSDRRVVGCEALVRWPLPNGQMRSPAEFLDVALETGMIGDIDLFVLDTACASLARFRREMSSPPQFVSVNFSVRLLTHEDLFETVHRIVRKHGLTMDSLCVEIPETAFFREHRTVRQNLEALRKAGAFVALDDFGTGSSSLGALRRLPVDVLKIDKSFVDGLGTDPNDTAIVTSILSLAGAMGLHVVAEGAETWPQVASLNRLGCRVIQGFRLARPVAVEQFASTCSTLLDGIPDKRGLARTVAAEKSRFRGQPTFIDEFLHQLNVPRRSSES